MERLHFDEPQALRQARAAALLFPGAPWALSQMGDMLRRLGEPSLAAEELERAVKLEPASVGLRSALARAYLDASQVERGCQAAQDALLYGPEDASAFEVVARCDLARGNTAAALVQLGRARELRPSDVRFQRAEAALRSAVGLPTKVETTPAVRR